VSRVLIVEDEPLIADFVQRGLKGQGYSATVTDDVERATALALTGDIDLVVLDLGLPVGDGFSVLRAVRERGERVPVIVLTGRPDLRDAVACLESGADDYMTKPFHFEELLARVRALLRRSGTTDGSVLTAGDLTLDLRTRRATIEGRTVELTAREFALLETFLRHADQVLTREQLLSHVWGYFFDPGTNVLSMYVATLRKKLGADVIETVRGVGYRIRVVKSSSPAMSA
jgi:DNA-binding response OmpR family regulator